MEKQNLNYLRFPILKMVEQGFIGKLHFFPEDLESEDGLAQENDFKEDTPKLFKALLEKGVDSNIQILSQSFSSALIESQEKMYQRSVTDQMSEQKGILLYPDGTVYMYWIQPNGGEIWTFDHIFLEFKNAHVTFTSFKLDGNTQTKFTLSKRTFNNLQKVIVAAKPQDYSLNDKVENPQNHKNLLILIHNVILARAIAAMNFIRYAQIETKHLPAGQKTKTIECIYKNTTRSNITFLNSTWFTNLVKSDSFKVRGHFRLQPYGPGLKEQKLIWINDYEKTGYTAPARKLKEFGE